MPFYFEEFPVYKDSLKYISDVDALINKSTSKITASLLDQLNRASFSIALNIAEGAGRFHKADKRNFYIIARGSVYECVASLQIMLMNKLISVDSFKTLYDSLNNLAKQLSALIKI